MSFFSFLLILLCFAILWQRISGQRGEIEDLRREQRFLSGQIADLIRKMTPGGRAPSSAWDRAQEDTMPAPRPQEAEPAFLAAAEETASGPAAAPSPAPVPGSQPGAPAEVNQAYRAALAREAAALREKTESGGAGGAAPPAQDAGMSGFEFQFGKKLPVWIGGVAIALSGFYLFKYAIEQGLITPAVRCILGGILGFALIGGARFIRLHRPKMADGARIAQALAGSGIAVLYATVYAATRLYEFIPPSAGLIGMAIVTFAAVLISLLHGMPVAILGMVGGFLTPALIHTGSGNGPALFSYLFIIVAGMFVLIRLRAWWVLALPVMLFAFGWVLVWMFAGPYFRPDDGLFLGLFLLAVCAAVVLSGGMNGRAETATTEEKPAVADAWRGTLGWVTIAGTIALMALVTARCDFGLAEWFLYGVLGLGSIVMAWLRPSVYDRAPVLAMGANIALLLFWRHAPDSEYALTLLAFAALYALPALILFLHTPALYWGGMVSGAALGFYGLAYARLKTHIYPLLNLTGPLHFWSALALLLALGFAALAARVFRHFEGDEKVRDRLLALFSLMTTAFISIALLIEVHKDFLPVAFAAEMMAVCWVASKIDIKALRRIAGILFCVFLALLAPQLLLLFDLAVHSLVGLRVSSGMPQIAKDPLFQLGLPMLMAGASSWFLRLRADGRLVEFLEMTVTGLGALMLYYLSRHLFKVPDDVVFRTAGFFERGVITNVFFAAALLTVCAGRFWSRRALLWSGSLLFAIALFRVFYFDFFVANPFLASGQRVGEEPFFNALLLPYALPLLWLWLEERPALRIATLPAGVKGLMGLLLAFMLATSEVRQFFHGTDLRAGATENAEIYTYSAVWLLLGAGLLLAGTLKKNKPLRIASLAVMILTVGKVFLYDAGELTGLFRVASFLGLGLSLLALSWFYSRFVFREED